MTTFDKKEIKRKRMMSYFIDAADKIIDEEGIDQLTIRKVADLAGYNSATIYNYFENLEHLVCYSAISYLKEYYISLNDYIKEAKNGYERFLLIWEKFCTHSYKNPKIYRTIFFSSTKQTTSEIFNDYFSIFPFDFEKYNNYVSQMLIEKDIYSRDKAILMNLVEENYIREQNIDEINDFIIVFYRGMLARIIDKLDYEEINIEEEVKKTVKYIRKILEGYKE